MMMTFRIFNGSMKTTMVGVRILISSLFFHKNAIFLRESVRIRTHHVQILCMCFVYTTNKKVQNCGKTTTSGITNKKSQIFFLKSVNLFTFFNKKDALLIDVKVAK